MAIGADGRVLAIRQPAGRTPAQIHVVVGWAAELSSPPARSMNAACTAANRAKPSRIQPLTAAFGSAPA